MIITSSSSLSISISSFCFSSLMYLHVGIRYQIYRSFSERANIHEKKETPDGVGKRWTSEREGERGEVNVPAQGCSFKLLMFGYSTSIWREHLPGPSVCRGLLHVFRDTLSYILSPDQNNQQQLIATVFYFRSIIHKIE